MSEAQMATMQNYKYRAFVSYSHKDEKWADRLHKALDAYFPGPG